MVWTIQVITQHRFFHCPHWPWWPCVQSWWHRAASAPSPLWTAQLHLSGWWCTSWPSGSPWRSYTCTQNPWVSSVGISTSPLHREHQSLKKRCKTWMSYLSPPTWTSSKSSHCPRTSSVMEPTEVWMEPPHAWRSHHANSPSCQYAKYTSLDMQVVFWVLTIMVLFRSSSWTLPAQNRSLSAKYWVATSPIGNLDRTTLAPDL